MAVKVLLPSVREDAQMVAFLQQTDHRNLVRYFGNGEAKGRSFIVMEHCIAGSIEDFVKRHGPLKTEQDAAFVVAQIVQGLAVLHRSGLVHRDIKPANILIAESFVCKLSDFGESVKSVSELRVTPLFMAPEIVEERPHGPAVDVWALGIVVLFLLEGVVPRATESFPRLCLSIANDHPPRFSDEKRWSVELRQFVELCLKKSDVERATAEALAAHPFLAKVDKLCPAALHKCLEETLKDKLAQEDKRIKDYEIELSRSGKDSKTMHDMLYF